MLLCKDRRRNQHCHLLPVIYGLERSSNRNLRLPIPDVATNKSVHGRLAFHVHSDIFDRLHLVPRLLIREGGGKGRMQGPIGGIGDSRFGFSFGIQRHEFGRHLENLFPGFFFYPLPGGRSQLIQNRCRAFLARVLLYPVHLLDRDIHLVVLPISERQAVP